ncbi:MAG: hypothetical protein JGK24_21750 [Microcoleus sp. PH2017_29_MFU_D_A]|jgi:hypothetical protein|nr:MULTISPECIES: hypothetical protein [unclassified Microcoleus]MCC3418531.1 hypothetical protein [Microcoleus sp. PH2017_07_MST_O_A]MCC3431796.1 hypothetical protein [Microcoleus sp. PH2017_04_SCI_O_A]MCC3444284.1 hypothetical protein [Microcoleus sp. PH2017_03_ELD_O_A]MCC3469621.1 hypothetical protein [Microcoleus sp. PH2017_06_SFM_O_A]MCC3505949.1 hypothetical protein [Microcoleus sp. PH2017_19_SFW_U_A]MCC3509689.1 hypothetical protein [Microcoleus sp. PH2017_17_BER_D_A]
MFANQSLQGVAPGADCPYGITLNVVQKLRGKDSREAIACTVGLLLI